MREVGEDTAKVKKMMAHIHLVVGFEVKMQRGLAKTFVLSTLFWHRRSPLGVTIYVIPTYPMILSRDSRQSGMGRYLSRVRKSKPPSSVVRARALSCDEDWWG